jgi:hypothetical protein
MIPWCFLDYYHGDELTIYFHFWKTWPFALLLTRSIPTTCWTLTVPCVRVSLSPLLLSKGTLSSRLKAAKTSKTAKTAKTRLLEITTRNLTLKNPWPRPPPRHATDLVGIYRHLPAEFLQQLIFCVWCCDVSLTILLKLLKIKKFLVVVSPDQKSILGGAENQRSGFTFWFHPTKTAF